jgi:hypothetical protein
MNEKMSNGDILVSALRNILLEPTISKSSKEFVEFILERPEDRIVSLLAICQKIFIIHPESLVKMHQMIYRFSKERK